MMKGYRTEDQEKEHKKLRKLRKEKKKELQDSLLAPEQKKDARVSRSVKKLKKNLSTLEKDDPIFRLGYGIVAYRDIMWSMIICFALFSLLMIPQRVIFKSYNATNGMMLSALGYSKVSCFSLPVEIGNMQAGCDYGTIGEVFYLGVANAKDENNFIDQCSVDETN